MKDITYIVKTGVIVSVLLIGITVLGFFFGSLVELESDMEIEESNSDSYSALELVFGTAGVICVGGCILVLLMTKKDPVKIDEEEPLYVLKKLR